MVALLLSAAILAGITQSEVDEYLDQSERDRPLALAEAQNKLDTAKRERHLPKYIQRRNLKAAGNELRRINAKGPWYAPMPSDLCYPEDRMIGYIDQPLLVKAIIDGNNAIVEAYMIHDRLDQYDFTVQGPPYKIHTLLYWFIGDTEKFKVGRETVVRGVYKVDGKREVPAKFGRESIHVLRSVPEEMLTPVR